MDLYLQDLISKRCLAVTWRASRETFCDPKCVFTMSQEFPTSSLQSVLVRSHITGKMMMMMMMMMMMVMIQILTKPAGAERAAAVGLFSTAFPVVSLSVHRSANGFEHTGASAGPSATGECTLAMICTLRTFS